MRDLTSNGVPNWHANFELINSLSFFRSGSWQDWILRGDIDRVANNNSGSFAAAEDLYARTGIGLGKSNFLSAGNRKHLNAVLHALCKTRKH